jgi:hypothetical protein
VTPRAVESAIADLVAELGPVIGPRIVELARLVVAQMTRVPAEVAADPEIPHTRWPFATSRRQACRIARSGAITGARREGDGRGAVWLARQSALDAYLDRHAVRVGDVRDSSATTGAAEPTAEDVNRELGLERVHPRSRGRWRGRP